MPDKHEVGGSSPLGPTSKAEGFAKVNMAEGDLVLSSSESKTAREQKARCKERECLRGNESYREI